MCKFENWKQWILIVFVTALFFCCKKKQQTVPVNASLKSAYGYNAGTYWIMRDTISGQVDSFVIYSVEQSTFEQSGQSYEKLQYDMGQYNLTGSTKGDSASWQWIFVDNTLQFQWMKNGVLYAYSPLTYPFVSTYFPAVQFNRDDTLRIINSYTVGSNTFSNVTRVNYLDYGLSDWIYFNAPDGLIEIVQSRLNKAWVVQRWQIE